MFETIDDAKVCYRISGKGNDAVLLHGWGGQKESFAQVHRHLEAHFRTCSIDLPGFGQSDPPRQVWGSGDYAEFLRRLLQKLGIRDPIIIGHSFGGKVAVTLASIMPVRKLVLVNSAGIRPKRGFKYYSKVTFYKAVKHLVRLPILKWYSDQILGTIRGKVASRDYQNASGVMREILVRVVNEDLKTLLPYVKAPTLLIWGENDQATPLSSGKLMEKLIPDSGLVVLTGTGHFSYLEKMSEFLLILDNFFQNESGIDNV